MTWTITRKPITVTAEPKSKVYGEDDPALTYHVNPGGLVGVDTLSGSLTRQVGEDVGIYVITQGTVTNASNPNYSITYVPANFEILREHAARDTAVAGPGVRRVQPAVPVLDHRVRGG